MGLTNDDGEHKELTNAKFGIPVLLDSGTTYTYLPRQLFNRIAEEVGIEYTSGASIAPCELRNYNGSIDFGFSGYQVHVPFNEMIIDAYDIYGERITYSTGDPVCFFGIFPEEGTASSSYVLGDTFLRSAYIVYDLDNAEVSLANVHFNVTNR